jgi:putative addiction module component (TIGR02574 family)
MEVLMSQSIDSVVIEALKLTREERARVADRLLASLNDDDTIEKAWEIEVERRIAEIESGNAPLVPAADAIARARNALK